MAITIGPNGEIIKTTNGGLSSIGSAMPTNMGALNFANQIDERKEYEEKYTDPVTGVEKTRRAISVPKIGYDFKVPDQKLAQQYYSTRLMPGFRFATPRQIGTTVYYPDEENLMSDENLEEIGVDLDGTGAVDGDGQMGESPRVGEISSGIYGAGAGAAVGSAIASEMTGAETVGAGFSALNPLGKLSKEDTAAELAVAKAGDIIKGDNTISFMDRLNPNTAAGKANYKQQAFSAAGDALFQVAAGADPITAIKSAGKTAVLTAFANAIVPGSATFVRIASKLSQAADIEIDLFPNWDWKF